MPKKAKEETLVKNKEIVKKADSKAKSIADKSSNKSASKKVTTKKAPTSSNAVPSKKSTAKSKPVASKKAVANKKVPTKKSLTKKTSISKKTSSQVEYYDLPTVYNKTVIKLLAQTPNCLFVYWEISEKDKSNLQKQYGKYFFQNTKPYLLVKNETKNYTFEVEISDYANSWYLPIHDSDCKYLISLIRKPINSNVEVSESMISITSSNEITSPNDHILFDRLGKTIFFRNVKTNLTESKNISSISFISNIGKIYNIYDFYKEVYQNELNNDELGTNLSSSQFSSNYR